MPRGFNMGINIHFTPKYVKTYTVLVQVAAKGICDTKKNLMIEVVA